MGKQDGPMSYDMRFELPEKETCICYSCKHRKHDDVFHFEEGRTVIVEQWRSAECEVFEDKPSMILFNNAPCKYYEEGEANPVFQPNWSYEM
jgi:hypothetical protein